MRPVLRTSAMRSVAAKIDFTEVVGGAYSYIDTYTGTNTATLGTHQSGDILVAIASRDTSTTAPSIPAGNNWTTLSSTGSNSLSYALVGKIATGSSEGVGTFTNATSVSIVHFRPGSGITPAFGAVSTSAGANTVNQSVPSLTLSVTDGSSLVLGIYIHSSADIAGLSTPPNGMTHLKTNQDATDTQAVYCSSNQVSSWTVKTVSFTGTAGPVRCLSLEILLPSPNDSTPNAFAFTDQTGVALDSLIESNTLTLSGTNVDSTISITGGEYSVNSAAYTSASGTIAPGSTFKVRHTSSASNSTNTDTVLTIGGVSDTFRTTTVSGGSAWQLSSGRYESRVSDIVIIHPRPDTETNAYAQHRNAYPGLAWSTHIVGAFGAWPYRFELAAAPSGMTIGQDLTLGANGLEPGANYGLIEWSNPTTGTHTVTVNIYDQEYGRGASPSSVATVTFQLVVGTSRFVFIDPVSGSDANAGTLAAPFQTISKLHGGSGSTTTYNGKNVYLRSGTHSFTGMSTDSNIYAIYSGCAPTVFVGYPGETATLSFYQGHLGMYGGTNDLMFKDLTVQMTASWGLDQRFFVAYSPSNRHSWHNVTFYNYRIGTGGAGENPAAMMYRNGGGGTATDSNYISVNKCTFTGTCGALMTLYNTRYVSFQHNNIANANFTGMIDGSNAWALVYIKDGTRDVCIRSNKCYENNTWGDVVSFAGAAGQNTANAPYAYNNLQYSYNKVGGGIHRGFYGVYEYTGTPGTVYGFRNSVSSIIADSASYGDQPTTNAWTRNAASAGFLNMTPSFVGTENLTTSGIFDSSLNLVAGQSVNFGLRGAQIYAS